MLHHRSPHARAWPRDVVGHRHRGDPVHPPREQDVGQRVGHAVTVLDAVHAGAEGRGDPIRADGVGGDLPAQPVRLVYDRARFVVGEVDPAV